MDRQTTGKGVKRNLLLMAAAGLFVALAVVLCLALRPKAGQAGTFVIRTKSGETLTVAADETRRIVVRDGVFVDAPKGISIAESGETDGMVGLTLQAAEDAAPGDANLIVRVNYKYTNSKGKRITDRITLPAVRLRVEKCPEK